MSNKINSLNSIDDAIKIFCKIFSKVTYPVKLSRCDICHKTDSTAVFKNRYINFKGILENLNFIIYINNIKLDFNRFLIYSIRMFLLSNRIKDKYKSINYFNLSATILLHMIDTLLDDDYIGIDDDIILSDLDEIGNYSKEEILDFIDNYSEFIDPDADKICRSACVCDFRNDGWL